MSRDVLAAPGSRLGKAVAMATRVAAAAVLAGGIVVAAAQAAQAASASPYAPAVTLSPGPYRNGQNITIAVGPNKLFYPGSGIYILECADPGGITPNLPIDDTTCDGNTVQGNTVIVGANGSFTERGYTLYRLPNGPALGEPADSLPRCDPTHYCVLYIGHQQNDFARPHVFSAPFRVGGPWSPPSSGFPWLAAGVGLLAVVVAGGAFAWWRRTDVRGGRGPDEAPPKPAAGAAPKTKSGQRQPTRAGTRGGQPPADDGSRSRSGRKVAV